MDIAVIHIGSLATRVAQVAAAELAAWLQSDDDFSAPVEIWFDQARAMPEDDAAAADEIAERQLILDELGGYVCERQLTHGETLYRFALEQQLVAPAGEWADLELARRQPWELFVSTCRTVFGELTAVQVATIDARRQAMAEAPATMELEDSIFEVEESLGALRPEAVAASRFNDTYLRAHQEALDAARKHLTGLIAARGKAGDLFNGADPAKFDHDGDGRPGGSAKSAIAKSIERNQRQSPKPAALSVGEAPVRPPVNRGGRGRKKGV